jgi:multicomponent Na+:H+ antiporter subunit E
MKLLIVTLLMGMIWVVISGSASAHNLIFGLILSVAIIGLLREQINGTSYLSRIVKIISLLGLFLLELAKSAWKVSVLVLSPRLNVQPGIFAFPLTVRSDAEITLLANLITLTPGTLSVDVSDDRTTLYVHALDCSDPDAARREIANGFERKILEVFQ